MDLHTPQGEEKVAGDVSMWILRAHVSQQQCLVTALLGALLVISQFPF